MMWFFAILLVLLMGGIAVVASGRGQPLAEADRDRPEPVLPVGDIGGDDLRRTRFTLAFRGYRMAEVDALLDRLARQLDDRLDDPLDDRPDVPGPPVSPRGNGEGDTP